MIWPKLLLITVMAVSMSVSYDRSVNYWEAFAPGKLLKRLDALTQTDDPNGRDTTKIMLAQAKSDDDLPDEHDADADDEDYDGEAVELSAETASHEEGLNSAEDYERNYEQFVREHFDRATEDDENVDDGVETDTDVEAESQSDASLEAEASHVQHQRCRRVQKKGQLCEICRHPKNGEVSETCSYSHADQPKQYAYGTESQYRRYRDIDQPTKESTSKPNSLCVRRLHGKRVCYDCQDSGGNKLERCYDTEQQLKSNHKMSIKSRMPTKSKSVMKMPEAKQSQHTESRQRIYKRTISYSFAQEGSNEDVNATTVTPTTTAILSTNPNYHQSSQHHRHRRTQSLVNGENPVLSFLSIPKHNSSSSQQK
ncbi:uncharacterized protein [Drosophila tropicalis]|uniref:uncharacterized protein n=1 Tax=Drosophila tropicalis TaxID=46794 RepID=UPI0035ABDFD6